MKQIKQHSKGIIVSFTLFIGCTFCGTNLNAQNAGFNYTGVKPHSSAIFDISDSAAPGGVHKGLLIPRMTKTNRNSISNPATSLLIYQTDSTPGFYFNSGTPASKVWTPISSGGSSQWTTSGNNIYYNTGSVGIGTGTTTPTAKLHVVSTGTTTAFTSVFQNAAGVTQFSIRDDGRVGVGVASPSCTFDVRAQPTTYENLFMFTVNDVPTNQGTPADYVQISNSTNASGSFAPLIAAVCSTSAALPPLEFRAETPVTANDNSANYPMTVFNTYVNGGLAMVRPIAQFRNHGEARVSISPKGSIYSGIPGGNWLVDHTAQLVVVSTASTYSTYAAKFRNSSLTDLLVIRDDGKVGIGVSNPSNLLELGADNAVKPNGGSWSVPSDIRLKKDTSSFSDGLDLIRKIKPIKYKYNGLACTPTDNKECIGISAQEMQKIAPYMVRQQQKELSGADAANYPYEKRFLRNDKVYDAQDSIRNESTAIPLPVYQTDILVFDPSSLMYVLINAVKELDAANADTKKENKAIKDENAVIRQQLDDLKKRLEAIEAKK